MKRFFTPQRILMLSLGALLIRNLPLCVLMPIWSHGDEIGHLDYVLKIGRGQIPQPSQYIESGLFLFHRGKADGRYLSDIRKIGIWSPKDMGLGAYSYEAFQPPLPYVLMAALRAVFLLFGPSFLAQVLFLRIVALLAVAGGFIVLYAGLRKAGVKDIVFYSPLFFIALLAQDMFMSLNTDAFAFLAGCLGLATMIVFMKNPRSPRAAAAFCLSVIAAMWTKATLAFFFVLWPLLIFFLWKRTKNKKIICRAFVFLLMALLLSSPWYLYNQSRFSSFFGFQFHKNDEIPYKAYAPGPISLVRAGDFAIAFGRTLIRGELLWNGAYFDIVAGWGNLALFGLLPGAALVLGLASLRRASGDIAADIRRIFTAGALAIIAGLFCLHFAIGGIPFYHARYAFGGLAMVFFLFAAGWKLLFGSETLAVLVPAGLLLVHNAAYTAKLLHAVL